jgi:hypothetical protein
MVACSYGPGNEVGGDELRRPRGARRDRGHRILHSAPQPRRPALLDYRTDPFREENASAGHEGVRARARTATAFVRARPNPGTVLVLHESLTSRLQNRRSIGSSLTRTTAHHRSAREAAEIDATAARLPEPDTGSHEHVLAFRARASTNARLDPPLAIQHLLVANLQSAASSTIGPRRRIGPALCFGMNSRATPAPTPGHNGACRSRDSCRAASASAQSLL